MRIGDGLFASFFEHALGRFDFNGDDLRLHALKLFDMQRRCLAGLNDTISNDDDE